MFFKQSARRLALSSTMSPSIHQSVLLRRSFTSTTARLNAAQQPSAYRQGMANYKTFAVPFSKVFLGAVLTFQIIYWTWLKLETSESKLEKKEEMARLEKKARELAAGSQK